MILDNLPARRFPMINDFAIQWTGYPVGFTLSFRHSETSYITNHLKFKVLVRESDAYNTSSVHEVVGFEVIQCSVKHDPEAMKNLKMYDALEPIDCPRELEQSHVIGEQERITFTYEVVFEKSDTRWSRRWDVYLKMAGGESIHWLPIKITVIVIAIMAVIISVIILKVGRDLTHFGALEKDPLAQMKEEASGWKLVVRDVFREPDCSKLLCIMVGDGVQITSTAIVTIILAYLGYMSPSSRGMLLTEIVVSYFIFGIAGGYAGVRLWRTVKGPSEGWISLSFSISCFFPGIVIVVLTVLNIVLWASKSTGAILISEYFGLLLLWFFVSVPLTFLGGYLGSREEFTQLPAKENSIPHEIPARKFPSWLLLLSVGILPFGALFVELYFVLFSIWLHRIYYLFGFLLLVSLLVAVVCTEVSVLVTYLYRCQEDWKWWWKSFLASGSTGVYVFVYSMSYLELDLELLSDDASAALHIGYSLIIALAILVSTGTIGFLMSFYFVHLLRLIRVCF